MKRIVVLLTSVLMAFGLAGCSFTIPVKDEVSSESQEESVAVTTTEEPTEEASSEDAADSEEPTESSEESQDSEESSEQDESSSDDKNGSESNSEVADAIQDTDTTDENAAAINQWVKTAIYSPTDETYHSVYVRVTKVVTSSDDKEYIEDAIALNNSLSSFWQIDESELKVPSDAELCVMEYEVYVPEDFPTNDYGIIAPDISFSASNIGGGGIPSADGASTYIGMGSMTSLSTEEDPSYQVGNTYSFRNLYMMVKGYQDYVFHYTSYVEGTTEISSDVSTTGYHKPTE